MAEFGWAFIGDFAAKGVGPSGSVQFLKSNNDLTGSENLTYLTSSTTLEVTGTFIASGSSYLNGFASTQVMGNSQTINYNVTMPANYNSLLIGPITIASGINVTVGANSNLKIKDIEDV